MQYRPSAVQPDPSEDRAEDLAALLEGTPYQALRFLGRGRMGEVWAIKHAFLGRRFALKVMHRHLGADADRMRVEAQTMARLNHPNVVDVVDYWVSMDGRPCLVMELLTGRTLWDELKERIRLPLAEALTVTSEALSAVVAAHSLGVIHRDIKPENLFLHDARGYGRLTKVLDFGIARILPNASSVAPEPAILRTITGAVIGSPRFMSPEAECGAKLDARTDVFSLGVVLYVMLTGQGPFDAGQHVAAPPSQLVPELPQGIDDVVLHAIRDDVATRTQSAQELLDAIRPWAPVQGSARQSPSGMLL